MVAGPRGPSEDGDRRVTALQRISAAIDRLNDRIGSAIQWLALVMVVIGAFNAIARYTDQYTGMSLSSNAYLDLQWYFFSLIFLMGSAYGLNHDYHVRVDVMYARLSRRARAWIDLTGSVLFLVPFAVLMFWISWGWVVRSWTIRSRWVATLSDQDRGPGVVFTAAPSSVEPDREERRDPG